MPELPLNDRNRDPLARHLDSMSVPKLMRRQPPTDTGTHSSRPELLARRGRRPRPTGGRTTQHTQQRPDRQRCAQLDPRPDLLEAPPIHPHLTSPPALPAANQN
jgi:hypothetical protein